MHSAILYVSFFLQACECSPRRQESIGANELLLKRARKDNKVAKSFFAHCLLLLLLFCCS